MIRFTLFLCLFILAWLKVAHLASFLPEHPKTNLVQVNGGGVELIGKPEITMPPLQDPPLALPTPPPTTTAYTTHYNSTTNSESQATTSATPTTSSTTTTTTTTTTQDPNADLDDLTNPSTLAPPEQPDGPTKAPPENAQTELPGKTNNKNQSQPENHLEPLVQENSTELFVLFASIFMVYVSTTKLIYQNVSIIRNHLTEPGILMMFGICWELVLRQITTNHKLFPRFNSKVFFYLFLPSTVLESASLLSNKWLYINLLPILIHSIIGTLCCASALAFTIYSLTRHSAFNFNTLELQQFSSQLLHSTRSSLPDQNNASLVSDSRRALQLEDFASNVGLVVGQHLPTLELANLTLADCLVFGTILSSVDSSTLLGAFRIFQVNDKLYYLILGENLMNNAVVLVVFNLLLEFFNATRLTVVKIYFAVMQFFVTLIGSVFIGLALACLALISVRLTKKLYPVPPVSSSYQHQYQAMVETLLILKLAYLSYTVASAAGTSSILSLATFGILHDQYIKHNLNLRSQLTFKQVILATRTLGSSLVYPLLGMLLVDVASSATSEHLEQVDLYWNFKFLAVVILFTLVFRFSVVIILSMLSNLFSSSQLKINYREQILIAYGGLKGPLAFAMVHKLVEHEEFRDRTMRNKHLFMYTILSITFLSTIIKGSFIKPLVSKLRLGSNHSKAGDDGKLNKSANSFLVFEEINCKVLDYIGHGMNSVLGHRKSPYERFIELNEVSLKPRLARSNSNTNWLSVFYDNLILDETLNANCFHRSDEQILPMAVVMQQNQFGRRSARRPSSSRRWQMNLLDTIAENRMLVRKRVASQGDEFFQPIRGGKHMKQQIVGSSKQTSGGGGDGRVHRAIDKKVADLDEKSMLKEFVMYNLKIEEGRRRPSGLSASRVGPRSSPDDNSYSQRAMRMLSTSGSDDFIQSSSSIELKRVQRDEHVDDLERKLQDKLSVKKRSVILNPHRQNVRNKRGPGRSPLDDDESVSADIVDETPQTSRQHIRSVRPKNVAPKVRHKRNGANGNKRGRL